MAGVRVIMRWWSYLIVVASHRCSEGGTVELFVTFAEDNATVISDMLHSISDDRQTQFSDKHLKSAVLQPLMWLNMVDYLLFMSDYGCYIGDFGRFIIYYRRLWQAYDWLCDDGYLWLWLHSTDIPRVEWSNFL